VLAGDKAQPGSEVTRLVKAASVPHRADSGVIARTIPI